MGEIVLKNTRGDGHVYVELLTFGAILNPEAIGIYSCLISSSRVRDNIGPSKVVFRQIDKAEIILFERNLLDGKLDIVESAL
jgi:hypothetical protein